MTPAAEAMLPRPAEAARRWVRAARARADARRCLSEPRPLVVYTAPKTGSTSVEAALEAAGIPAPKIHFLHRVHAAAAARHAARGTAPPYHCMIEARLGPHLLGPDAHRFRVLSMVRDPVAQKVSDAFQSPRTKGRDPSDTAGMLRLVRARIERMAEDGVALRWFAEELGATFGFDPASSGLDPAAASWRLSPGGAELMIAKTERLDALGPALSAFAGRELALGRRNVREGTGDAARYRAVRDAVRLAPTTLDAIYGAPMVRALFAPEEIAAFRSRWSADR